MTMGDYLTFLREHLRGLKGQSTLLSQDTFVFLHIPVGKVNGLDYACGWIIQPDAFEGMTLHGHDGTAGTFYLRMHTLPGRDFAAAVGTNAASMPVIQACTQTLTSLVSLHLQADTRRQAGSDDGPVENQSIGVRYSKIQTAIEYAEDGDIVVIDPGVYHETIDLTDKDIVLRALNRGNPWPPAGEPSRSVVTMLQGDGSLPVVTLSSNTEACMIEGITITAGSTGIRAAGGSAKIAGCCIVDNLGAGIELADEAKVSIVDCVVAGNLGAGIAMPAGRTARRYLYSSADIVNCTIVQNGQQAIMDGRPTVANSILYYNATGEDAAQISSDLATVTYSDVQGGFAGEGNIDAEPLFADPANGDYHLKSQAGRWEPATQAWITDDVTSPCIDTGDPNSDWTAELWPHGKRINMGAYGGTGEASMSLSELGNAADFNHDDRVNLQDLCRLADSWRSEEIPLAEDLDRDSAVDFKDVAIFGGNWLWQP